MKSNKRFVATVIIVAVLINIFAVLIFFVYVDNELSPVLYRGELNKFDQRQETLVKDFYNIPQDIDVALIKHRQERGGWRAAAHSEVFFYLSKNDVDRYRDSLDKWMATNDDVGYAISFDNKDYVARYCYEGDEVWDEPLGEMVWILESLNDDSDRALIYIHQKGFIEDISFAMMQYSPDYYKDRASSDYDI